MSPVNNALALGIVGNAKFVGNAEFIQKILEFRGGVGRLIVRFDGFGGTQNGNAMWKMGDNITSSLTSVEGGAKKTTECVYRHMNIFKGAKGGEVSNICLPKSIREKAPGIGASGGFWQKGDTSLTGANNVVGLFSSDGKFQTKSLSI